MNKKDMVFLLKYPSTIRQSEIAYSQEGEDIILDKLLNYKGTGFFVDVGAHHPFRFSNTFRFYKRGWRGLNIDATPGSMDLFKIYRPYDINIEAAVSTVKTELEFYMFNEPALNTFDKTRLQEFENHDIYKVVESKKITTKPLAEILEKYVHPDQEIDFFDIDVEGFDLDVLRSNNWDRFRPKFIVVEVLHGESLEDVFKNEITYFLRDKKYEMCSKLVNTVFFKHTY